MMRRRWFLALKCGSGKQKKSFRSCPRRKKFGRYFMELVRSTATLWCVPSEEVDEDEAAALLPEAMLTLACAHAESAEMRWC